MKRLRKLLKKLPWWVEFGMMATGAIGLIIFSAGIIWAIAAPLPAINNFENRKIAESTKIFDRTGNIVLFDVYGQIRRTVVPLEEISPYIQKTTVAIEDAQFYAHKGFRPLSFMRAMWVNLSTGGFSQGGSTITQQVVKNALLTQKKTIARKIEEIILALRLDRAYSKEQILATYLNETPYGGTIYGVQEASQFFFGVDAKDVDLAQAAYLAALPQAPTRYSPSGNHRDLLDARQKLVLKRALEENLITDEEYKRALEETVEFRNKATAGIKAPHFVFFIREYLEEKYGADAVAQGGLRVITTLDWEFQEKTEEIVARHAPGMFRNFNASNEAVVAVEPKSGQILAMIGSRGYFDETIDGKVNTALAHRQPGSSFKPFVYATAFKKGYTPETVVFDLKTQFSTRCAPSDFSSDDPCYSPNNFDETFKGPITLRHALAQSINVPAVKTLYLAGVTESLETARDLGITTLTDKDRYGLTLVLGGGEVTLLDLTGAYAVFANDGIKNPPVGILRVEDKDGNVLEEYKEQSNRVLDAQIARQISDILSDEAARAPEFGANSPLYFRETPVADKTGTTNDYRDVWIVGYTTGISIGAWAGNNNNTPMEKKIAASIITPMWHEIMDLALQKYPSETFTPPAPENPDTLPPVLRGSWSTDPARGVHEILYWIDKDNPRSGLTGNHNDPQFALWEYPVALFVGRGFTNKQANIDDPQQTLTGDHLRIVSPEYETILQVLNPIIFSTYHPRPDVVSRVTYYINNEYVGTSLQSPYSVAFIPKVRGTIQVKVVADTPTGKEEASSLFMIR